MDRAKNRFSSKRFWNVIDLLSEDQKAFVVKNRFEKLLSVRKFSVPMPFLEWVMGQVVVDRKEFKHRLKSFKFTRFMVEQIIGIPSGDTEINLQNAASKSNDAIASSDAMFMAVSKMSIAEAIAQLLAEHEEESFMRLFILVALSTILCPSTQNFVNLNYAAYLLDISAFHKYDWASHVLSYIMSEVKKYQGFISSKDNGKIYVGSCLPLLAISFLLSLSSTFYFLF